MPGTQNVLYLKFNGPVPPPPNTAYEVTRQPAKPLPNVGTLECSNMEFDEHKWFQSEGDELLIAFTAHFSGGPRTLHYHPGSLRNHVSSLVAFGSFIGKLAVMANAIVLLRSPGSSLNKLTVSAVGMKATKRGFDVRQDWHDVVTNLNDSKVYSEAGYYDIGTQILRIRGKIHRSDGYVRDI